MTEYIYLYESGKSDPIACRSWERAVHQMLSDYGFNSLDKFIEDIESWDVWFEHSSERGFFYADDGPRISKVDLI